MLKLLLDMHKMSFVLTLKSILKSCQCVQLSLLLYLLTEPL